MPTPLTPGSWLLAAYPLGFTLIEILLAIFIFAIVLSTIYASYTGTFKVINTTEAQAEVFRKARIAMGRIIEDLESVCSSGPAGVGGEFIGKDNEIEGLRADSLRFLSSAHLVFSEQDRESGRAMIEYEVRLAAEGHGLVLLRHDRPVVGPGPADGSAGLLLCDNLLQVRFVYHDAAGIEHDGWDSTAGEFSGGEPRQSLPRAVSVMLQFRGDAGHEKPYVFATRVVLPVRAAGS